MGSSRAKNNNVEYVKKNKNKWVFPKKINICNFYKWNAQTNLWNFYIRGNKRVIDFILTNNFGAKIVLVKFFVYRFKTMQ